MANDARDWENLVGDAVCKGDVIDGKYRIDGLIGVGGMAVVLEAWHLDLEERVAVKLLNAALAERPEALARFEREARAAVKIKSEHVARVLDVGKLAGGAPYIVMEFLEGSDLATRLEHGDRFGIEEAVDYILEACEAVQEAHARGIVHRDLKPENLFLALRPDGRDRVKVLDFGVSKIVGRSTGHRERKLTGNMSALGTPHYMSPEQWESAGDVGPEADIWALGVMLYELLAGVPPFDARSIAQLCKRVLHDPAPSLLDARLDVPADLDAVIQRCLEKEPHQRYATVAELAEVLAPFASDRGRVPVATIMRMEARSSQRELAPASASMLRAREGEPPPSAKKRVADASPSPVSARAGEDEARARQATASAADQGVATDTDDALTQRKLARPPRQAFTQQSWQSGSRDRPRPSRRLLALVAVAALGAVAVALGLRLDADDPHPAASGRAGSDVPPGEMSAATAMPSTAEPTSPSQQALAASATPSPSSSSQQGTASATASAPVPAPVALPPGPRSRAKYGNPYGSPKK